MRTPQVAGTWRRESANFENPEQYIELSINCDINAAIAQRTIDSFNSFILLT